MKKLGNFLFNIILLVLLVIIVICVINIISWVRDNQKITKETDSINKIVDIVEVDSKADIINNGGIAEEDPYWDYIKMNLMSVDFEKLLAKNSDTIGFVKVNGTSVNYPFVQTKDNKYYLSHSFSKEKNDAGWVFMDYRNAKEFSDKNTILYAHGRVNNTMFGSLNKILNDKWLGDKDNHVVKIATPKQSSLWQIFSVYHIKTTSDYTYINFNNDDDYQDFLDKIKNRSAYNFNTEVSNKDKIFTLSTCYNNSERMVIHAKMIKVMERE